MIAPVETPAPRDADALYAKALLYVQHIDELSSDDWDYALWSSLSLEFLARAALANVTPRAARGQQQRLVSMYHALGFTPTEEKFAPRSIAISEVFKRLSATLPLHQGT